VGCKGNLYLRDLFGDGDRISDEIVVNDSNEMGRVQEDAVNEIFDCRSSVAFRWRN
jgi:hypothetical protein